MLEGKAVAGALCAYLSSVGEFFGKGLQFIGFMRAAPIILVLFAVIVITNLGSGIDAGGIFPELKAEGRTVRGKVVRVIDGDTLEVRTAQGKETVRMLGIDTPETVRPGVAVECGGPQASAFMKRLAEGTSVKLVTDPTQDERDRYGRLLAYVYPSFGQVTYQQRILAAGWAEVYVYGRKFRRHKIFAEAEGRARAKGAGVWSLCGGNFHRPA